LLHQVIEGVFERFSFSTEEGEEEDAHIDPEMLGRVFESLMAGEERLASGSFYTPREIVDRLAGDSILRWLLEGREELIESFAVSEELGGRVSQSIAAELLERLGTLKIIDPACGSGAFLLSAVRVIESLQRRLSLRAGVSIDDRLRQRIVESSIHGVDLKPEAVRLCELRLWLAIVSESDAEIDSIPPLPNLDRNILQGSALLGALDFLGDGRGEIYREWSYALRARALMLGNYRRCSTDAKPHLSRALREADRSLAEALIGKAISADRAELRRPDAQTLLPGVDRALESRPTRTRASDLRRRIEGLERELKKVRRGELGFFSFEVHYAHVMSEGGFDLVIGNPPWVRSSRIPPAMRAMLQERYRTFRAPSKGFSQPDLAVAFCEKSMQIARPGGIISLLVPAKVATASYASRLRSILMTETELVAVHDWSHRARNLFDADTFPMSLMLRKERRGPARVDIGSDGYSCTVDQSVVPLDGDGSPWLLVPAEVRSVIHKMRQAHPTLAETLGRNPVMGVKTGANRKFFLDELVTHPAGTMFSPAMGIEIPRTAVCRTIRGRDLRAWRAEASTWMLWPPVNGWGPGCAWVDALARVLGMDREEIRLSWVRAEHLGPKVAWKDVSRGLQAAAIPATTWIDGFEFPLIPNQTLYSIDTASMEEAHMLAALLNSTVARALSVSTAERAKDRHFRFFGSLIAALPLPLLESGSAAQQALVRLARQAEAGADVQQTLDIIVMQAYGLDQREMEVLARYVRTKVGAVRGASDE
ncbi:MAG TPA: N-6 DNA methylase, partial [Thermoanaerobaculia bacterium]|nr:N-6 DNA methylase [Thermoanaerobaculia bacterium]